MPLKECQIVAGWLFGEPTPVGTVKPNRPDTWNVGLLGMRTEQFRGVALTSADLAKLSECN